MTSDSDKLEIFCYPISSTVFLYVASFLPALVATPLFVLSLVDRRSILAIVIFGFGFFIFPFSFVINSMIRARVKICSGRIESLLFGRVWKSCRLEDIRRIRKIRNYDVVARRYITTYLIASSEAENIFSSLGPIQFREDIINVARLISILNMAIEEFSIPVTYVNRERDQAQEPKYGTSSNLPTREELIDRL